MLRSKMRGFGPGLRAAIWLNIVIIVLVGSFGCHKDEDDGMEFLCKDRPEGIGCDVNPSDLAGSQSTLSFDPEHVACIKIEMAPKDLDRMRYDTYFGVSLEKNPENYRKQDFWDPFYAIRNDCTQSWPSDFTWFSGSVQVDNVLVDNVGIHKKGFLGSLFCFVAPSVKIKTDKYVSGQYLGDTERLTLNNNAQDETRMRTCLAYELFAAAQYPAPRCHLAHVMFNGEPAGVYEHVESIKKRFLRHALGSDDGDLYEGPLTDFVEPWLDRWEAKTGDTNASREPLRGIVQALEKPDEELIDALSMVVNLDRFMTFWALEVILNHADGYAGGRNNFYVYFDPQDNHRAVFIPWGADITFYDFDDSSFRDRFRELDSDLEYFVRAELPRRLSRIPAAASRLESELERLIEKVWNEAVILSSIDRYAAQVRAGQDDPGYDEKITALKTWIRKRPEAIHEMLQGGLPQGGDLPMACNASESSPFFDDSDAFVDTDTLDPSSIDHETETLGARIVINEIAARGDPSDWFEVHNLTDQDLPLAGYTFTDDIAGEPDRGMFPDDAVLPAGGHLVFYCTDEWPGFKLGGDEEFGIYSPDGELLDSVDWNEGDSPEGQSWGRIPDGMGSFMETMPTPGQANQPL